MVTKSSDRPTTEKETGKLPFIAALPSAISSPIEGQQELAQLVGATIMRIGTTSPGLVEGGELLMDYADKNGNAHRIVFGFTERGMWIEQEQLLSS